mmetsp:Transcript_9086/g.13863  ORF Transcript_9086/g.13863 Transcript_9086/m.13863 type:complete len:92 (+) Transcript_9086:2489-2764(+)
MNSFHQASSSRPTKASGSQVQQPSSQQQRPITSYSSKVQKQPKKSNISDVSSSGGGNKAMESITHTRLSGGGNTHVINQSLKPKMIMHNNN